MPTGGYQVDNGDREMTFQRRDFLKTAVAAGTAIALPAAAYGRILGANAKVNCAVIGVRSRGLDHIAGLKENVVALCDCDEALLNQQAEGKEVERYQDYRKLLDNPSIDAVSIATPNHSHALIGISALMAGKHVYVEKPVSHNVWEGRQLVAAQSKYNRVVQCGTQSRSSPSLKEAVEFVRAGKLGRIQYAVGTCFKPRKSIGKLPQPLPIPATIDYDLWCGPAEKRAIYRPSLHYDWHWDFNTGSGDMGNQGIHQMDIARWFLGYESISPRVLSVGGRLGYNDAGNTPNTQVVFHDYPEAPLIFETRGLPRAFEFQTGADENQWDRQMDDYRGSRVGVVIQCEQGYVSIPSYTDAAAYDNDDQPIKNWSGGGDHYANFLDAVRANDQSLLNAPVAAGHLSSALCHTGNVSHQLGKALPLADIRSAISTECDLFQASVGRLVEHLIANQVDVTKDVLTMGIDLKMDPSTEQVTNHERGNQLMSREYRAGFEVSKI